MEFKVSAKAIVTYGLLPMFLLQFSSLAGAVDIIFFTNTGACTGSGYAFNGIGSNICCAVSPQQGGSVLVTSTSGSSTASKFYRGGACGNQVGTGSGNFCLLGGQFTGAFWYNARRRSLLSDSEKCDSQMKPTGVAYTEDGMKGNWILPSSDADALYSQMQNIPDAEKVSWLQSHGATYNHL